VSDDCCRECGLDLAADPDGEHDEGHRLCWSCWHEQKQKAEPSFTLQDSAEWWIGRGITDLTQLAEFMRMDFRAGTEVGEPWPETDEYRVVAEHALRARTAQALRARNNSADALVIRTLEEFTETDEPTAGALLGSDDAALIAANSDALIYGDGGAGKTTLVTDLAFHLAAKRDWIGIPVPRALRVLLIENEGPRPFLRDKLRRKLDAWDGDLGGRLRVYEQPWGKFSLADESWRERLAQEIADSEIDVLIAGPVSRIGMDEAGTLAQVRAFAELVADLRERCGRALAVILVHHENKAGDVSGAWEGSPDTLLHVKAAGNGHTIVYVQKARWSSQHSQTTFKLAWTPGEGFAPEDGERDLLAEIVLLLLDGKWRTVREIAATDKGGIGASFDTVKGLLEGNPERFKSATGEAAKALGRSPTAALWGVSQSPETPGTPAVSAGEGGAGVPGVPPVGGDNLPGTPHLPGLGADSDRQDSRDGGTALTEPADRNEEGS
jgi:hypothetical protein